MPVVFGVPGFSLLPFLTYETIITGSDSPESQRHMLPLNTGEPGEFGDGNSSVAPPAVYGRGLYLFKRGIGCVSCASKDAGNLALLAVFVNSCKPFPCRVRHKNALRLAELIHRAHPQFAMSIATCLHTAERQLYLRA